MPKKLRFWSRLKIDIIFQFFFCICSMLVLCVGYFGGYREIINSKIKKQVGTYDNTVLSSVECIENEGGVLELSGYMVRLNSSIQNIKLLLETQNKSHVFLCDVKEYATDMFQNSDITWDTGKAAFKTSIGNNELIENICYEIYVYITYVEGAAEKEISRKFKTNLYLYNGDVYRCDVTDYETPLIKDNGLTEVIQKGTLCTYSMEENIYIYQYEDNLYWIIPNTRALDENGLRCINHFYALDVEKLPENRQPYWFDNYDFYFKDKEIKLSDEHYRVAISHLPKNYLITEIRTGLLHEDGMTWVFDRSFGKTDEFE